MTTNTICAIQVQPAEIRWCMTIRLAFGCLPAFPSTIEYSDLRENYNAFVINKSHNSQHCTSAHAFICTGITVSICNTSAFMNHLLQNTVH